MACGRGAGVFREDAERRALRPRLARHAPFVERGAHKVPQWAGSVPRIVFAFQWIRPCLQSRVVSDSPPECRPRRTVRPSNRLASPFGRPNVCGTVWKETPSRERKVIECLCVGHLFPCSLRPRCSVVASRRIARSTFSRLRRLRRPRAFPRARDRRERYSSEHTGLGTDRTTYGCPRGLFADRTHRPCGSRLIGKARLAVGTGKRGTGPVDRSPGGVHPPPLKTSPLPARWRPHPRGFRRRLPICPRLHL